MLADRLCGPGSVARVAAPTDARQSDEQSDPTGTNLLWVEINLSEKYGAPSNYFYLHHFSEQFLLLI
ncbi:protein of unknown function [Rhodovastum atsumiense]|nr:protein of unknown function [Rhodovastum atsumiense]